MPLLENIQPLKKRRTKIIATMGPAVDSPDMVQKLINAGVNVFRLNMSHGNQETHQRYYHMIRKASSSPHQHISILADLCGPKIRCGSFPGGSITLIEGNELHVTTRKIQGDADIIPSQYSSLSNEVESGHRILLADGVMQLRVLAVKGSEIRCLVEEGGILADHQGMNLPDTTVSAPALTDKDRNDADFAVALGVDFLALSFVSSAQDVIDLRQHLNGKQVGIIAKIERPEAVQDANAILEQADAIMIARGDLGVEIPAEQVPVAQKILIDAARVMDKPVIVATQMLESMIEKSRATRAEVTDVFHSVTESTDAVMLSGETAAGKHPLEAVKTMDRIVRYAEGCLWQQSAFARYETYKATDEPLSFGDAVARSMAQLSRDLMVRAVIVFSPTGVTAKAMSAARPEAPVLAIATTPQTCRRLNLLWGVIPVLVEMEQMEHPSELAASLAQQYDLASLGETVLLVRGFHKEHALNRPCINVICV